MLTALISAAIPIGWDVDEERVFKFIKGRIHLVTGKEVLLKDTECIGCEGQYEAPGIPVLLFHEERLEYSDKSSEETLTAVQESKVKSRLHLFLLLLTTKSTQIFVRAVQIVQQYSYPVHRQLHFVELHINLFKGEALIVEFN